ncbi:HpcH/HpaI aldolase family protein [Pyrobaculum calidifontis]|uniref:2-dehydro-3-deoxyglucarate aldolase n=1 Tax=Pyrobaculum calidifontis (strain DSM 21063 / JCM 11548 / VA1) TaxID=410359 RepID=A3MW25_PYRCJ|nr:aldolase/citrate lyase family protein [Pyrobaculum calidifontis]ABO08842.1 2-dehydro-3-deoxyglucarate aldolase [Pyrobaculum calidifontis JCM 11548]
MARAKLLMKAGMGATFGVWITIPHPEVVEILSNLPFDWFMFDMEHAPITVEKLETMLMPLRGSDIVPLARVPWNDPVEIKRVLDLGVAGVLVPWVNTREEAERAVKAVRYPPWGIRGVGPRRSVMYGFADVVKYYKEWDENYVLLVQVETAEAVENVEEIASVEGVTGLFVGPNDLSASLGAFRDFKNPKFTAALERVLAAAKSRGKLAGVMTYSPEEAARMVEMGFNFVALSHDVKYLVEGAKAFLRVKELLGRR